MTVVLFHYTFRGYAADNMSSLNFNLISHLFKYGYLGVHFFFMISGFVILLSIKHNSLIKFIISRITRLYPVYWLCVILTFLVILFFGAPRYLVEIKQLLINLTMFQNYTPIKNIDGVYWSLFVEMKFYIFIICTYLIINNFKQIKLDYLNYFWLLLTVLFIPFSNLTIFRVANSYLILEWSSYFIAGITFYQIFTDRLKLKYFFSLSICLIISLYHSIIQINWLESHYNTNFSPYIIGSIITTFYTLMFLISTGKLKKFNSPKLIKLGILTYPLYLLHQNIGFIIFNNLDIYVNKYLLLISTIIFMLFTSYIISKLYEPKASLMLNEKLKKIATKIILSLK
jgi:peptidoglycan/LPS O-acetylase OafA/YrhL